MTIDKAIYILQDISTYQVTAKTPTSRLAIDLGIEALKRVNIRREQLSWKFEPLLPGETT